MVLVGCPLLLICLVPPTLAQRGSGSVDGCFVLDKTRPALFISYERVDTHTRLSGDVFGKGVVLRLHNNTSCTIILDTNEDPPKPQARWGRDENGKVTVVSLPLELKDSSHITLLYNTHYEDSRCYDERGPFDGDVIQVAKLRGGISILFSVPFEVLKRGGKLRVPFSYEWDRASYQRIGGKGSHFVVDSVFHNIYFTPELLPEGVLK